MCSLAATSVGALVPRPDFEAVVHSVYHTAVNLQPVTQGPLLTVLLAGEADLPQGIRLEASGTSTLQSLMPGAAAVCRGDVLSVGNALVVDLRPARRWDSDLRSVHADMTDPAVVAAWREAWEALLQREIWDEAPTSTPTQPPHDPAYASVLQCKLNEALTAVVHAAAAYDQTGLRAIGNLIGLGSGLTPTGDDLLIGFLAGLWCTQRNDPRRHELLQAASRLAISSSDRTNDVAGTYLQLAARGLVSSRILDLVSAIGAGSGLAHVRTRARAALQVGHTSGMDTVRGLLLGLAAWDAPHLVA